jgi:hypothetical protein
MLTSIVAIVQLTALCVSVVSTYMVITADKRKRRRVRTQAVEMQDAPEVPKVG